MFSTSDRSLRVIVTGFTAAGLLAFAAACDSGTADTTGTADVGKADGSATSAGAAEGADKAPARTGAKVDLTVSGEGMKGGCDAVRKIFVALDAGDRTVAQSLKAKGLTLFDDVAATSATSDLKLATDGATMASDLGFQLPEGPIYRSTLATDYTAICVARYQAAPLPG